MKRIGSILLALVMAASLILSALPVAAYAEGSTPEIALGAGPLAGATSAARNHTVWFGRYNDSDYGNGPVQWRVLSGGGSADPDDGWNLPVSGTGEALLISKQLLDVDCYFKEDGSSNQWAGSDAQAWCENFWSSSNWLTAAEKSAVNATTLNEQNDQSEYGTQYFYKGGYFTDYYSAAPLNGEHIFFLSAREADKLFTGDSDRQAQYVSANQSWWWWLRSPLSFLGNFSGLVDYDGWVDHFLVDCFNGARPAFNLNLSSVLFSSAAEGGKSIAVEDGASSGAEGAGVYKIPSGSKTDWKLTLHDESRDGFASSAASLTGATGGKISIPYTGAKTGNNEYVSILVCSADGKTALCYGSYKISAASGTASFVLPSAADLPAGSYTVKLFSEQRNGDHESDYASGFVSIPLTVGTPVSYTVTFKVQNGEWNNGGSQDITKTLNGIQGQALYLDSGDIPAVGGKPNTNYKAGGWDTAPNTTTAITQDTTYTYAYAAKDAISQTVTFTVVNGSWDDGTNTDKVVTLNGLEGDTLKLAANHIPAVGNKPGDIYKAGSWNVTPSTEAAITGNPTYTYTYAAKDAPDVTPPTSISGLYFTGENQALVTPGSVAGGEMQYALGADAVNAPTSGWSAGVPTGREAKTYYVWYRAVGDGEHTGTDAWCVTVTVSGISYSVVSGGGQEWRRGGSEPLSFTVKRSLGDELAFGRFDHGEVDGAALTANQADTEQGSLILRLKPAYLETLSLGGHTVRFIFSDGAAEAAFTVKAVAGSFEDVAVPSDSFTFKKVWEGDAEKSIDFTLYKLGGEVYHHGFDKKTVSRTEWRYNAWFSAPAACYVIEEPVEGYITRYENVGVYAGITDRCCDGGTIINKKIPKTGDETPLLLWAGMILLGAAGVGAALAMGKRRKANK